MQPGEVSSGLIEFSPYLSPEAVERGREFIKRVEQHIQGLTRTVEGQPIIKGGNVVCRADKNQTLYFMSKRPITRHPKGVTIDGEIHPVGVPEVIGQNVVIPADHIDISVSDHPMVINARVTSISSREVPPNSIASSYRCVAIFDQYRIVHLPEHDIAIVQTGE